MSDKKPVDLAVARTRANVLAEYDFDAGAKTIRDMADEIEALRALRDAVHKWAHVPTQAEITPDDAELIKAFKTCRALLPPA